MRNLMEVKITTISGMCLGIEFLWQHKIVVIDLLILRFYIGINRNV